MKRLFTCLTLVAAVLTLTGHAGAAQKANTQKTQEARKELDTAQDKLKDAREAMTKAQREFSQAESANQSAAAALTKARQGVYKLGLNSTAAERDAAREQVNKSRQAMQSRLKQRDDYQSAQKAANTARIRFGGLNDDATLTAEQRQKLSSELAVPMRRPTELEKEAEAGDGALQQALARHRTAEQELSALNAKVSREIEADPEVKGAAKTAKDAAEKLAREKSQLAQAQQQLNSAQTAVNREQQQLKQAQNQGDNKKKKKN
jgi:chromosome segregation ATPase